MELKKQIFREYDIRGTVDIDLDETVAKLIGRAYGILALKREHSSNKKIKIAVGWDCRLSSEAYAKNLAEGLAIEGCDVVFTGMGPTPQLYFSIFSENYDGGIQVTGSHNPKDMNGFKLCLGRMTLSGDEIQELYQTAAILCKQETIPSKTNKGTITTNLISDKYIDYLISNSKPFVGDRKLKIVVDAGNGVGGLIGPKLLRGLGFEVVELFCDPDGNFPNHHPDPTELKNIQSLIAKVKEVNADFGIGWDGDADRIGAVDENGAVIFGDMLLLIYAREILRSNPKATIIGDVKCSSLLFNDLKARGADAIMWKTGHSLIKKKLMETKAELAGEMSGHIFFKHRFFGFDDALYATSRLAEIVSNTDKKVSTFLNDLPKTVSTPEIRVDCPEEIKFKIVEKLKSAFPEYKINTTDGIRVEFEHGWGLVRASNTQSILVMRFEANTEKYLQEYVKIVNQRLEECKSSDLKRSIL